MTLKEAIGTLDGMLNYRLMNTTEEQWKAISLGIEALKQLITEREKHVGFWKDRLPGETKE